MFSFLIEKETRKVEKYGNDDITIMSYKIRFIDGASFMVNSLSDLADNLAEGIHKIKCKDCTIIFLNTTVSMADSLIKYKCLACNKNYSKKIDEKLKKQFRNTFNFSNNNINKFILLQWKGFYSYKYMDDWERFNEISLPKKEDFCSNLNMKDITDSD